MDKKAELIRVLKTYTGKLDWKIDESTQLYNIPELVQVLKDFMNDIIELVELVIND